MPFVSLVCAFAGPRPDEGEGRKRRLTRADSSQPAAGEASGGSDTGGAGPANGGGVVAAAGAGAPSRQVRWHVLNDVAQYFFGMFKGRQGPPDAGDEAGPSKRQRP